MHEQRHALAYHVIRVGVPLLQEVGNRSRRAGVGGVHEGRLAVLVDETRVGARSDEELDGLVGQEARHVRHSFDQPLPCLAQRGDIHGAARLRP